MQFDVIKDKLNTMIDDIIHNSYMTKINLNRSAMVFLIKLLKDWRIQSIKHMSPHALSSAGVSPPALSANNK